MRTFFIRWASAFLALWLLNGCATRVYTMSEPRVITLKTWQLKFNDVGFIRHDGDAVELELFSAGQAVETFSIDEKVCVQVGCMSKKEFNRQYLSSAYPENLMQRVLLGKPIFGAHELVRTDEGFEQHIKAMGMVNITYRVSHNTIYFKDRTNNILIKIKDINK